MNAKEQFWGLLSGTLLVVLLFITFKLGQQIEHTYGFLDRKTPMLEEEKKS